MLFVSLLTKFVIILFFILTSSGQSVNQSSNQTDPTLNKSSTVISDLCNQSINVYKNELINQSSWTVSMYDAQGKLAPGLFNGYTHLIGSYDECKRIKVSTDIDLLNNASYLTFHGVYCKVKLQVINLKAFFSPYNQSQVTVEVCAPSTCSSHDIQNLFTNQDGILEAEVLSCNGYSPETLDGSDITVICVLIILGLLVIFGTFLSSYFRLRGYKPFRKRAKVLIAFSAYENTMKLMDPTIPASSIQCLYGLRFLALCFIVLGHTYSYHSRIPSVNPESVQNGIKKLWFQVFLNFTPWVDTFFLISGLLVTYSGLKKFKKIHNRISDDNSMLSTIWHFINEMLSAIARRYWRLTPTLAFVICVYIVAGKMGSGPNWSFMENISNPCKHTWWRNFLYINNYYTEDVCLGHTWYLADDFQFYIISLFILIFLSSSLPTIGLCLTGSSLFASIIATAVITYITHSSPTTLAIPIDGTSQTLQEVHLYIWPFFRIGPFLIGLLLGYVIITFGDFVISKRINVALWFLCLSTVTVITLASYRWANGHPASVFESVVYSSLHRIVWSLCWSYMIISCHYGHCSLINSILSWKALVPLGRLTYHGYLVHLLFIYAHIASNRTSTYFSHYNMFIIFLGYLTISMLFSYISAICFELPFTNLETIFWPKSRDLQFDPGETRNESGNVVGTTMRKTVCSTELQHQAHQRAHSPNDESNNTIDTRFSRIFPPKPVNQTVQTSNILVY